MSLERCCSPRANDPNRPILVTYVLLAQLRQVLANDLDRAHGNSLREVSLEQWKINVKVWAVSSGRIKYQSGPRIVCL